MSKERGCGTRAFGGIYAETPLSPYGVPVEFFLIDPPIPVDLQELGLTSIGVKLFERSGVWHILDVVGQNHYPNVADFVEELKCMGLSRRLPSSLDFSKISENSKIFLIHQRAFIKQYQFYFADAYWQKEGFHKCPVYHIAKKQHEKTEMCAGLWWFDLDGENGMITREMPSFQYAAHTRPPHIDPSYQHAFFAALPIKNLAVIKDSENSTHFDSLGKAKNAKIPVELVES